MLYEYKLREKIHNLKKKEAKTSVESAVTPEYTYVYLGSKSSQGRSITFDLLYQAAVVMCFITFIKHHHHLKTKPYESQSKESRVQFKQGKKNLPIFISSLLLQNWAALNEKEMCAAHAHKSIALCIQTVWIHQRKNNGTYEKVEIRTENKA